MNIIEKAVEKLEEEVEELLRGEHADDEDSAAATPAKRAPTAAAQARTATPAPVPRATDAGSPQSPGAERPAAPVPGPAAGEAGGVAHSERVDINLPVLAGAGYVAPGSEHTLMAEEYRVIKRPLLGRATPGDKSHVANGNLILVTSSLPGEGKTFNSINLALSVAMEINRTVLLVDADIAKSDVSRILGVSGRPGLSDFLSGKERDLSRLILRTDVDSLSVLPSGPRHSHSTELVASTEMRQLTAELASRYADRIVIFDSPPLLATTGASVMAGLVGQVVMVIEAIRTPQTAVREALRRLGVLSHVSVVYNKHRKLGTTGYGRYGYYGGYGYGADDGAYAAEPR